MMLLVASVISLMLAKTESSYKEKYVGTDTLLLSNKLVIEKKSKHVNVLQIKKICYPFFIAIRN